MDLNFKDYYYSWWIDSTKIRPHYTNSTNFFIDLIYSDYNFYKLYLNDLNNISKKKYFKNLIEKNNQKFNRNFKILKTNFPTKEIFSEEQIKITRTRIQDLLNPVQGLNVNFLEYEKGKLKLKISNLQRLPVEIIGIKLQDKSDINLKKSVILPGKKALKASKDVIVDFNCEFKDECKKNLINKQKLIFKILGQNKRNIAKISKY